MTSTATESDRTTDTTKVGHLGIITVNSPSGAPYAIGDRVAVVNVADTYYSVTRLNERNISTEGTWAVSPEQVNLLPAPEVGSVYTINKEAPRSAPLSVGDRVVVLRPYDGNRRGAWIVNQEGRTTDYWVSTDDLEIPVPAGTGTTAPDPRDEEIERLRTRLAEQERRLASLNQTWEQEVTSLGNLLMREADSRNWCNEYDEIVAKANGDLTYELPTRSKDIDISWTETYTVTVTRSDTITTREGAEEEDAVSHMENCDTLEEHELIQLLRENGWHEYSEQEFSDWNNC